jgi:hypothetical protein
MTVLPVSTIRNSISGGSSGEVSMPILLDFVDTVAAQGSGNSYTASSVAAVGSDQASAFQLSGSFSLISTGSSGAGVLLATTSGQLQIIFNATPTIKIVYPIAGMTIAPLATGAGLTLGSGLSVGIIVTSSTQAYLVFNTTSFG